LEQEVGVLCRPKRKLRQIISAIVAKSRPHPAISAKVSNPSKTQPRFDASNVFHYVAFSVRYHCWPDAAAAAFDIEQLPLDLG
jgi:hypothetical protein